MDKVIGIIWPTAEHLFDDIESAIRDKDGIMINAKMNIALGDRFDTFVFDLYNDGDCEQYGYLIDNKIHLIASRTNSKTIRVVYMEASDLDVKAFKNQIRSAFMNRVSSYEHDIIIHLTDSEQEYLRAKHIIQKYCKHNPDLTRLDKIALFGP